jgi:hypothetical protein
VAKLVSKGKIVLGVWYLVLWGICSYALFEWFYPHTDYMAMPQIPLTVEASLMLFLATGLPLLLYLRKHEPKAKATSIFLVATILLSVFLGLTHQSQLLPKQESNGTWMICKTKDSTLIISPPIHMGNGMLTKFTHILTLQALPEASIAQPSMLMAAHQETTYSLCQMRL